MRHALVTGGAGFVGSHLVDALLREDGWQVTVLDDFHPFYGRDLKERNVAAHRQDARCSLVEDDVANLQRLDLPTPDVIVHIAALAGVRPSFRDPADYYRVNVTGTDTVLRFAAERGCRRVVLASSSSVYGTNPRRPWREDDTDLRPISPYAVSKLASEHVAEVYARRDDLSVVALRLFTVYGPRQRPDLAIRSFAERIAAGEPLPLFGDGSTIRDYTFVDDIVRGFRAAVDLPLDQPMRTINLGAGSPITLLDLVQSLERALGRGARIDWQPEQPGDVPATHASIERARELLGYQPQVSLDDGVARFVAWQRELETGRWTH